MCIKISGNNFITYMRKKTNLVIFKAGKTFRSKIRSCYKNNLSPWGASWNFFNGYRGNID